MVRLYGMLSVSVFPVLRPGQFAATNWLGPLLHSTLVCSKGSLTYKIEWWAWLGGRGWLQLSRPLRPGTFTRPGHFLATLSRLAKRSLSWDILPDMARYKTVYLLVNRVNTVV